MKYTSDQISQAWKTYTASKHSSSASKMDNGGKIKHKLKHKKKEESIASADAQVEHSRTSSTEGAVAGSQHRAGGGIIEGKPGIDTNDAKLRPGSFVIPKKKVPHAIADGILKPKQAEKFQAGGVPVKLTAGEGLLSPEKAARLHADGVDLNEYAPDTEYPYEPQSILGMQYGGSTPVGERKYKGTNTDSNKSSRIVLPQEKLFSMGSRVGVGIDVHGKDTTMTFPQNSTGKKTTWLIKNKQGIYDPNASLSVGTELAKGGKIHIKKSHRGRFTAYKERTGKTTEEALHSKDPHVRKMAQFAKNTKHFKHDDGGEIKEMQDGGYLLQPIYEPRNKEAEQETQQAESKPTSTKKVVYKKSENTNNRTQSDTNKDTRTDAERQKQTQADFDAMVKRNIIGVHGAGGTWTPEKPSFIRDFGEATMNDLGYLGDAWNAVGQGMYNAGKGVWHGLEWLNEKLGSGKEPEKKNKGGKIKYQNGGGIFQDPILSDPSSYMGGDYRNPYDISGDVTPSNVKKYIPLYHPTEEQVQTSIPSVNLTEKPLSLFDQVRADQKKYANITTAEDLALLAGNLGSRYNPTPRPKAYTPDIYERNVNAEAIEQGRNLDKEASTARYNARNTGQSITSDPAITSNLMDKRLSLGAQTDTARENERKSVYEQRNQASLMNLNQNNQYNTMEANRLDDFRREKGQASMMMVDRLQDVYKSSIEDKYALLGAENQYKIRQEEAKNKFFASFGTTPSAAKQSQWDTDYAEWIKNNPNAGDEEFQGYLKDWIAKHPNE